MNRFRYWGCVLFSLLFVPFFLLGFLIAPFWNAVDNGKEFFDSLSREL